jgi:sulfide:quinone oxidoreductase
MTRLETPMQIRPINDTIAVSAQISPEDPATLFKAGFTTVINNRPDAEEPGQPTSAEIEAAAAKAGLAYHHIPVAGGAISADQIDRFDAAMSGSRGRVLAYCRSGTRSAMLWAFSAAPQLGAAAVLELSAKAGYDLQGLSGALSDRAQAGEAS